MEHTSLNGDSEKHYPGCVNISFAYVEGESLLMALKDIALSSGSACTSASLEPSYVLRALGSSDGTFILQLILILTYFGQIANQGLYRIRALEHTLWNWEVYNRGGS